MELHPIDPADIELPPTEPIDMTAYMRQALEAEAARVALVNPR